MERCDVPYTKPLVVAIDEADRQGVGMALALLMDACSSDDAQWEGGDVCEALGNLITDLAGWAEPKCPVHHCYSAAWVACPFCTTPSLRLDAVDVCHTIERVLGGLAPREKVEALAIALLDTYSMGSKE